MNIVMVFGTFDGVHPGHEYFLAEARKLGDRLVVCVARDTVVQQLKGHAPERPDIERREALAEDSNVDEVVYGDRELGTYHIVEQVQPHTIALGYDQTELKRDLSNWLSKNADHIKLVDIPPFRPDEFKSSLMKSAGSRPGRNSA